MFLIKIEENTLLENVKKKFTKQDECQITSEYQYFIPIQKKLHAWEISEFQTIKLVKFKLLLT